MRDFGKTALLVICIITFAFGLITTIFSWIGDLFGYDKTEKVLKKLSIPLSNNDMIKIGLICVVIAIITYLLRKKFFGA